MASDWPDATRYARGGLVCTVDHLASSAGIAVLRAGGSAADAAVAASAVLAVTTQHMCGAGGDLLAVVHPGRGRGEARALLAVGRAGSGSDPDRLRGEGHTRMPFRDDVRTVTAPGCVDGWLALHSAYGRLPFAQVLAPAIGYATDGFPVSPLLATAMPVVAGVRGGEDFHVPAVVGTLLRRPRLADALTAIGTEGREAWYGGAFGRGLVAVGQGVFTEADLARDQAEWTEPASLAVGDGHVLSTPTPTAGYLVLAGAKVAHQVGALAAAADDPHLLVEAVRVTGHDRPARLADGVPWQVLLDPADLDARAARIRPDRALDLRVPVEGGGTIYLCAADGDGMTVSLSQSNAAGFGAHLAVPEVGVFLHNRGIGFSLQPGHPAELGPGRRPTHTLCPSMLLGPDGAPTAIGTMGGDAQPQVLLQLMAALGTGATPAAALGRPRWVVTGPRSDGFDAWEPWPDGSVAPAVALEHAAPPEWEEALLARGHRVTRADRGRGFGHAHLARTTGDGMLAGASDPRAGTGDAQAF
ncbi:MAG: gamma-glutamyltransferase [Frankiaceae bacterium]|nr:gamma-glutamyltransferase [Frankiaceae bacterium]